MDPDCLLVLVRRQGRKVTMLRIDARGRTAGVALLGAALIAGTACGSKNAGASGTCTPAKSPVVTFAAYSTPREVYGKIIPAFQAAWKDAHDGQNVIFQESYGGSTSQAQAVVNGFKADVVALSLAP